MLTRLHILLTYKCSLNCSHCYVYSHQRAAGKISLRQISHILKEGRQLPDVNWIYFGGGEPFTQYPLLLKSVQRARQYGFEVGVETNGYFARTEEAGLRLLRPLATMGVNDIRISNDRLHYKNPDTSPATKALNAARRLGIPTTLLRIPFPNEPDTGNPVEDEWTHIIEPRLMFNGRAAETMLTGRRVYPSDTFTKCPSRNLEDPERLHVDAYGFVQICPGIAIGNIFEEHLYQIVENYNVQEHLITRHLYASGPSGLMERTSLNQDKKFVDACHCCYTARLELIDSYPDLLGPRQVYGF